MRFNEKKKGVRTGVVKRPGTRTTTDRNRPRPVNVEFFSPWSVPTDPRFAN